ncbi:MAG TPA: hypothetical protein VE224_08630 [Pseudolabrys sp.]|nr:hypothetical protein [Pseudolabrys sp.]
MQQRNGRQVEQNGVGEKGDVAADADDPQRDHSLHPKCQKNQHRGEIAAGLGRNQRMDERIHGRSGGSRAGPLTIDFAGRPGDALPKRSASSTGLIANLPC